MPTAASQAVYGTFGLGQTGDMLPLLRCPGRGIGGSI